MSPSLFLKGPFTKGVTFTGSAIVAEVSAQGVFPASSPSLISLPLNQASVSKTGDGDRAPGHCLTKREQVEKLQQLKRAKQEEKERLQAEKMNQQPEKTEVQSFEMVEAYGSTRWTSEAMDDKQKEDGENETTYGKAEGTSLISAEVQEIEVEFCKPGEDTEEDKAIISVECEISQALDAEATETTLAVLGAEMQASLPANVTGKKQVILTIIIRVLLGCCAK